jgi:hypothetical protein
VNEREAKTNNENLRNDAKPSNGTGIIRALRSGYTMNEEKNRKYSCRVSIRGGGIMTFSCPGSDGLYLLTRL